MGCCGEREKFENPDNEQKWDYINLSDFRSSSCGTPLSYGILYIFLIISVAVYAVDLFTCANLLFFDKWSGQVKPAIPFEISRWIFTGCIILSWVLLAFRWWRAIRAMNTGVVAASYLDPLAVRVQSIRMGANGRGWRRFLVFAALTKGRKGTEYVALFTYFSFEAWLRICFAEGPRQVINALTLYSVMRADLVPTGQHAATKGHTPVVQFFVNVQILADKEKEQAAILFGMLFTLIIWIFSALSLILAVIFYITFLWHHIRDGSLSRYCRRKIDSRLHKIVMIRVNKALEKDNKVRTKQEAKGVRAGTPQGDFKRQPTLPILDTEGPRDIKPISRQTTQTESPFDSRPPTRSTSNSQNALRREPTIPDVFLNSQRPQPPSRSGTQNSVQSDASYADDAPLINSAAPLGYGPPGSRHAPSRTDSERTLHSYKTPGRNFTGNSRGTQKSYASATTRMGPPSRQNTDGDGRMTPAFSNPQPQARNPLPQDMTFDAGGRPPAQSGVNRRPTQEYEMQSQPPFNKINGPPPSNGGYVAFNPNNQGSRPAAVPAAYPTLPAVVPPSRNFTQPQRPPPNIYFGQNPGPPQRSGTAPIPQATSYDDALDDAYGGTWQQPRAGPIPYRPATAGPGGWQGSRRPMPPRY